MRHDQLFRAVFGQPQHAAQHVATFLPKAIVEGLDLERLEVMPGTFIDEELQERRVDLLFSVPVKGHDDKVLVYVLLEHQHEVDPLMPLRLMRYMLRIWDAWLADRHDAKTIPPIFPMVLYQGRGAWTAPRQMSDLIVEHGRLGPDWRRYVPDFTFRLTELGLSGEDELGPPVHATVMRFMKVVHERDILMTLMSWEKFREDLVRALEEPQWLWVIGVLMVYLAGASELDRESVLKTLKTIVGKDREEKVMNAGERWEQSVFNRGLEQGLVTGREQGLITGLEQGRERERRELCLRLLERRFGTLSVKARRSLEAASAETLQLWLDRAVTSSSLEEVFAQS